MYSLKITPAAEDDLDKIYAYISDVFFDSVAAKGIVNRIENSTNEVDKSVVIMRVFHGEMDYTRYI